jgi:hypothetical protein
MVLRVSLLGSVATIGAVLTTAAAPLKLSKLEIY